MPDPFTKDDTHYTDPIQTLLDRIHKSVNWALRTAAGGQPDGWRHMDEDALVVHIANTLRAGLAPALHNYAVVIGAELLCRGSEPAAGRTAVDEALSVANGEEVDR